MSADHLPDDFRRWPRDPYQILGVAPRCDPREARKAYTLLIRQFKPEQFPDHFRLIREAYDAVNRHAQFLASINQDAPQPAPDHAVPKTTADSLDAVWSQACDGQEVEAYGRLREMYQVNPHGSEVPARLYALLLANPELDPQRTPCDWLAQGVRAEGQWGLCRQLYRREIEDHPDEALSERFEGLLGGAVPHGNVLEFLVWRWEAMTRLGRTDLISDDHTRVAGRLKREDEEGHVRVLLKAADYLAWQSTYPFDELCDSIESHVHVHAVLGEELSRLDFLRDLSGSWLRLNGSKLAKATPLLSVVPMSWTNPYENRHRILAQCRVVAEDPEAALSQLDAVRRRESLIPAHLGQTLAWLWHAREDPRDENTLLAVIKEYLGGVNHPAAEAQYDLYRWHLLRFCVAELIAPETVANLLVPDRVAFVHQRIYDDWPLRTVCLAHRIVWE